ncbi:hypothetical protein LJC17_02995 [Acholeplasma sp. OttesenSCG-928-E16]|nr:hypothetical protein [Acholeplasma sp. OttesenSCG-928-E16]
MDNSNVLDKVKRALMIPLSDNYADDELNLHISSCRQLLKTVGVSELIAEGDNSIVEALILIYCKTFFGFTNDGSVRELPSSFDMLLRQLALSVGE